MAHQAEPTAELPQATWRIEATEGVEEQAHAWAVAFAGPEHDEHGTPRWELTIEEQPRVLTVTLKPWAPF